MRKFLCRMCTLLVTVLLFSCNSSTHFPVPGERKITQAALHAEYFLIADAYAELENYEKAIQYYKLAMRDKNLYWTALYKLGRMYAFSKNWNNAKDVFEKLLARDPQNMSLKLSLAYIQAMSGSFDEAKIAYESLIDEQQKNETPLINYIIILLSLEDFDAAETQLAVLKERFPENTSISDFEKRLDELRNSNTPEAEEDAIAESDTASVQNEETVE